MRRMPKTSGRRLLLFGTLLATGFALEAYLRFSTRSLPLLDMHLAVPRPPISLQPSRFPCLDSLADRRAENGSLFCMELTGPLTPLSNWGVFPREKSFCPLR